MKKNLFFSLLVLFGCFMLSLVGTLVGIKLSSEYSHLVLFIVPATVLLMFLVASAIAMLSKDDIVVISTIGGAFMIISSIIVDKEGELLTVGISLFLIGFTIWMVAVSFGLVEAYYTALQKRWHGAEPS